jgi:hypothetical protein
MNITAKRVTLLAALLLVWSVPAQAQWHWSKLMVPPSGPGPAPTMHRPLWAPYYPYYGTYPSAVRDNAEIRVKVTPRQREIVTNVYIDGYYVGPARDFDGMLKRLHATAGGHAVTLYTEGYRTVTENIVLSPGSTYWLRVTMEKLGPGQMSSPPPAPVLK